MRRFLIYLIIVGLIFTAIGYALSGRPQVGRDGKQLIPLNKAEKFPAEFQHAARLVAESIGDRGEDPKEFFVEVHVKDSGKRWEFALWHESAFAKENENTKGNPGGKCRTAYYDVKQKKVTETLRWQ